MPDKKEFKRKAGGLVDQEVDDNNDLTQYKWSGRQLDSVTMPDGSVVEYSYYPNGDMKSRTVRPNAAQPGMREDFGVGGWYSGKVDIKVNNQITESYLFEKRILVRFTSGNDSYIIRRKNGSEEQGTVYHLIQEFAPAGGVGPTQRILKHIYYYDAKGKIYVVLDENLRKTNQAVVPKFLYMSMFYDVKTHLYYDDMSKQWYNPEQGFVLAPNPLIELEKKSAAAMGITVEKLRQMMLDFDERQRQRIRDATPKFVADDGAYNERRERAKAQQLYDQRMKALPLLFIQASNTWFGPGAVAGPRPRPVNLRARMVIARTTRATARRVTSRPMFTSGRGLWSTGNNGGPLRIVRPSAVQKPTKRLLEVRAKLISEAAKKASKPAEKQSMRIIPMGERIPVLPAYSFIPPKNGQGLPFLVGPGMKPRRVFKFNNEGGISEMDGMVTLRIPSLKTYPFRYKQGKKKGQRVYDISLLDTPEGNPMVRSLIHRMAKMTGLQKPKRTYLVRKKDGSFELLENRSNQWHEAPLFGNGNQVDVQSLPYHQHGMRGVPKSRHHRGPDGEGGTAQIKIRFAREEGIWVPRRSR